jgi:hypothetical protein
MSRCLLAVTAKWLVSSRASVRSIHLAAVYHHSCQRSVCGPSQSFSQNEVFDVSDASLSSTDSSSPFYRAAPVAAAHRSGSGPPHRQRRLCRQLPNRFRGYGASCWRVDSCSSIQGGAELSGVATTSHPMGCGRPLARADRHWSLARNPEIPKQPWRGDRSSSDQSPPEPEASARCVADADSCSET